MPKLPIAATAEVLTDVFAQESMLRVVQTRSLPRCTRVCAVLVLPLRCYTNCMVCCHDPRHCTGLMTDHSQGLLCSYRGFVFPVVAVSTDTRLLRTRYKPSRRAQSCFQRLHSGFCTDQGNLDRRTALLRPFHGPRPPRFDASPVYGLFSTAQGRQKRIRRIRAGLLHSPSRRVHGSTGALHRVAHKHQDESLVRRPIWWC